MLFGFFKRGSLLLVLCAQISALPTLGQAQNNPASKARNSMSEKALAAAVPLPDVPDFNGQKQFQFGSIEETKQATFYRERWLCQDDSAKVREWYRQSMGAGWELKGGAVTDLSWTRKDNGSSCLVKVVPSTSKKGKSELTVSVSVLHH